MPARPLPGGNVTGEFNPFQNLDLTRYGFGGEKQLAPLLFKGLADLKPQPVEGPATTIGAPPASPGASPYGAGGAPGGLNPFDFAGPNGGPTAGGLEENTGQRGPGAGTFLNTVSGNKTAMAFLTMLFPGLGVAVKGADYLQNRCPETTKGLERQLYPCPRSPLGIAQTRVVEIGSDPPRR